VYEIGLTELKKLHSKVASCTILTHLCHCCLA